MRSLKPGSAWIGCGPKSRSAILDLGPVHGDRPDDEYVDGDDDRGPDGVRREERHVDERTGERDDDGEGPCPHLTRDQAGAGGDGQEAAEDVDPPPRGVV